ncbi:MBL fold metallo-hydrolase [Chitinophaga sp. Hz27]|uniref:MBL fold metallo-hydrolase n=1 Tax=Chitinophaga sp. Hz27 TaxID=3347169 RepID=UPI0035DFDFE2
MTKIHHLNCVDIQSPMGSGGIGHCLLLETDQRLVLIDTGIGLLDTQQPVARIGQAFIDMVGYHFHEEQTAIRQIEKLGLKPTAITDCIISHLDNDHIGGLADFPDALVHVGIEEYENFKLDKPRYLKTPLQHHPKILTYGPSANNWFGFEARKIDIDEELDIFLIPLFGHSNGHCGVAIQTDGNWIFYVGDAYYLRIELSNDQHPINLLAKNNADNDAQRLITLQKIRDFVNDHPEITVFCYHDIEEFRIHND